MSYAFRGRCWSRLESAGKVMEGVSCGRASERSVFEPFIMQGYSELTRGVPNTTTTFSVEEVSTVHTKISQPGISWRNVIHDTDLSISLDSRICFSKYDYKIYCPSQDPQAERPGF